MAYQVLKFQRDPVQTQNTKTETMLPNLGVSGNRLDQGFFQDNNDNSKKQIKQPKKAKTARKSKTPYSPTKIKARNFLSNIAYSRICDKDFANICFLIDVFSYLTMDLKPFFHISLILIQKTEKWLR